MSDPPLPCSSKNLVTDVAVLTKTVEELEKRFHLHTEYQRDMVRKAALELRERLEGMNEFRAQLRDQASRFITRDESIPRLEKLELINAYGEGKMWAVGVIATLAGGAIGSIVAWLLGNTHR